MPWTQFLEIPLGVGTLVLSASLWSTFKRKAFLRRIWEDERALSELVSGELLVHPPGHAEMFVQHVPQGLAMNLLVFQKADESAMARVRLLLLAGLVVCLGLSAILGPWFLAANLALCALAWCLPIGRAAVHDARAHVQTTAVIMHRWRTTDPAAYAAWLGGVPGRLRLHEAIVRAGA